MKFMLPLLKGMEITPALSDLLMNKIVLLKKESGEPVKVAQGTEIIELPEG